MYVVRALAGRWWSNYRTHCSRLGLESQELPGCFLCVLIPPVQDWIAQCAEWIQFSWLRNHHSWRLASHTLCRFAYLYTSLNLECAYLLSKQTTCSQLNCQDLSAQRIYETPLLFRASEANSMNTAARRASQWERWGLKGATAISNVCGRVFEVQIENC